jgi:hypothetical protein
MAAHWRGACFPKPVANDAPAWLARATRIELDSFRLVRLGSRPSRQDRAGPDMTDAARARCYRQRHRDGRAVVAVEIDIEPVTEYLVDAGILQLAHVEDRAAIGVAIRDLIDLLIAAQHLHRHA